MRVNLSWEQVEFNQEILKIIGGCSIRVFVNNLPSVPAKIFNDFLKSLDLDEEALELIAQETGWQEREPRKITAAGLLSALCVESMQGETSFNDLSSRIGLALNQKGPSKQAVSKRINSSFLQVLEQLLARLIEIKTSDQFAPDQAQVFPDYPRVLLQDSTVIKLPGWLFAHFSGVSNGHQQVCNARIQVVYDLKKMSFESFEIAPYSKNDLKAAPELSLEKGDLVLRDRGYLSASEIARHKSSGAHCIYRHKTGTRYLDPNTGEPLDLLKALRKNGTLDQLVLLNDSARTPVRLVSAPVDQETAALRRMRAKKETHGHNPSSEVLALMEWTIFLTTVPREKGNFKHLLDLYGLRWRIETIFKTWKSHLSFESLHRVSEVELKTILPVRLLLITEGTNVLYRRCYLKIRELYGRDLSLQKFLKRLTRTPELFGMINQAMRGNPDDGPETWDYLLRYCCYDKRARKNFFDQSRDLS